MITFEACTTAASDRSYEKEYLGSLDVFVFPYPENMYDRHSEQEHLVAEVSKNVSLSVAVKNSHQPRTATHGQTHHELYRTATLVSGL